ncbi:phosphatidylserine decarboxylase [Alkaliphilus crotonatoxidans]
MEIRYIDRKTGEKRIEMVPGDRLIRWSYESSIGNSFLELLIKKRFFSNLMGRFMNTALSKKRIKAFVENHGINMKEALQENIEGYRSFNDFFIRELKSAARPTDPGAHRLASPADGKLLAYDNIDIHGLLQVKKMEYSLAELIGKEDLAAEYHGGVCIVVRLAPADYHRFHFPDDGIPQKSIPIKGNYYSVNPRALNKIPKLYCQNKRELTIFESKHFGKILLVEVGATGVGSIVQTYQPEAMVEKGQEKGYFKFGGSTTILFIKKDQIEIDEDLLNHTAQGYETRVIMGEGIGTALNYHQV